ncbi:sialidase family protein [Pseudoroseicyclus tamaricis]|uniref:Exo-alpha-sialidase n=1 Tax=Pseudoroseicyclus tamaricis TaxID=2705421 RepID=A0A6B2JQE6_9RHOB|nr:sialidase family protein [Pseudoroseicyclus tamaricis]NDV00250.1 exo-alpha-sialidase [Pseudoroseicyclus tamaricis]
MRLGEPFTIYANPAPLLLSRQAAFPGLVSLGGGELLAMFSIGQAFDAADMRSHTCRSRDGGRTWSAPVPMHGGTALESESFKPVRLPDGRLLATGYVFERPDMVTPIVDPATRRILPLVTKAAWSSDDGATWSVPRPFDADAPLELSGPALVTSDGRLLAAGAPFHLGTEGHEGWLIESRDGGGSWQRLSVFYRSPGGRVAPWECRLAELGPGRIAVLFWAYDTAADRNLDNHLVLSEDGGQSFGPALATGIMGQASNLMPLNLTPPGESEILTIHCHRAPPVSLTLRRLALTGEVREEADIFTAEAMGAATGNISAQFGSLKFGQPSLTRLSQTEALAAWWQVEDCQHVIKGARIELGSA